MTGSRRGWASWVAGAALVIALTIGVFHWTEAEQIARAAERAQPWWLLLAVALQCLTYAAQGEIWCATARASRFALGRARSFRLGVAKLFVDQAVPTVGIGGTAAVAQHLEHHGMPRSAVMAGVVVNLTSYFCVYIILLIAALALMPLAGAAREIALATASVFILGSLTLLLLLFAWPRRVPSVAARLDRIGAVARLRESLGAADRRLIRSPALLTRACLCQAAIVLCDAATVWTLIVAFGGTASAGGVFAAFMLSNLFRSVGILPGGLGTFEASSVFTLQHVGVSLPVALSATLLFRALSFWLPMIPGAWLSRRLFGATAAGVGEPTIDAYWALAPRELAQRLGGGLEGLSSDEAVRRQQRFGANRLAQERPLTRLDVLARQFANPLLFLLVFAAVVASATGELTNAVIVLTMLFASALIGYSREYWAESAAAALRARITVRSSVLRDGVVSNIPSSELVPGDVVLLAAGSLVPADAIVLEARDCHVSEAVLTGESFPVEKTPGISARDAPLAARTNCVFLGTNVRSGTARCLVVATGVVTQFGAIARRLTLRPPQTEFDRGMRRFGYLLTSAMLLMALLVFVAHMFAHRPVVETLLFAVALALGLSPELLPAILSVNLSRGAQLMAEHGVLVRRLNAIENLGSMDILCTDKTGTLTQGVISLEGSYDPAGRPSRKVAELGALNAAFETGLASPLDDAITAACQPDLSTWRKRGEIPFDFIRKRVSVVVEQGTAVTLICKGAVAPMIDASATLADGRDLDAAGRAALHALNADWNARGIRVLAVATRELPDQAGYDRGDERALVFRGFLTFLDQPKPGVAEAIGSLSSLGVSVKLITGDSRGVAQHVAAMVGMRGTRVISGRELDELRDEALWHEAERTDLFVEVDPNQKERIILALKKMGHVVGFLGDGVNDAPAMHAADTSLSVEEAVDVAREAADFVLLRRDLDVIREGVEEGRRTFANTLKYVLTTTSANLGNMLSMAATSLFLPFLPLTAGQILLNNFLSDVPAVGIASDAVDRELIERPRRWDMKFIGRFMVEFGLLSSAFDLLTFGVLLWIFQAGVAEFRAAWFVESLLTELVIALVVRTRRPGWRSRPGRTLLATTVGLSLLAPAIPYLPYASDLGFAPLPASLTLALIAITAGYVAAAEALKHWFYRPTQGSVGARA